MKKDTNIMNFKNIPINIIIFVSLFIFLIYAFLIMFYSNGSLVFSNKYSFYSLLKAKNIAENNFIGGYLDNSIKGEKIINGFLYPFIMAIFYKILGGYNLISIIYILEFLIFLFSSIIFYQIVYTDKGKEIALISTILFTINAPIIISIFSGTDIIFIIPLFLLNVYFLQFDLKNVKGIWITNILLLFTNYIGIAYSLISFLYYFLYKNKNKIKRYYFKYMAWIISFYTVIVTIFFSHLFIEKFSISFFEKNGFLKYNTLYVDSFFKDGFLFSKIFAPFFVVFSFLYLFFEIYTTFKNKKIDFNIYILFLVIFGVIADFFAAFKNINTMFFLTPVYIIILIYGIYGLEKLSEILHNKKIQFFNRKNVFYGFIIFILLYNLIFSFNNIIANNNKIKYIMEKNYINYFIKR